MEDEEIHGDTENEKESAKKLLPKGKTYFLAQN